MSDLNRADGAKQSLVNGKNELLVKIKSPSYATDVSYRSIGGTL